jgi:hypothetical protein
MWCFLLNAQNYEVMKENEILDKGNLKASYTVQKIRNKKDQDAYDITLSVRNDGYDIVKIKNNIGETEYDLSKYWLANIKFANSTGSAFTIRDGHLETNEIFERVSYPCGTDSEGKQIMASTNMLIGYGIRRGQTINSTYRIRVPEGEDPRVEIQFVNYN